MLNVTTLEVKQAIIAAVDLDMSPEDITDDSAIIGTGLELDSVDMLDVVIALERKFSVKLRDNQLKKEVFSNIQSLTDFMNLGK